MISPSQPQAGHSGNPAPLPWLVEPRREALRTQRGHAILLQGPQGLGQFELALTMAQAWLCEATVRVDVTAAPCGVCASCRLVQAHSHPDLLVLLPEALRESLGWAAADGDEASTDKASKAKPSKEIKAEAVRHAVVFAQTTSARGRSKVVVVHPAERMNAISANTLLKTLEEPPGDARFVLSCAAPESLLPTIRSRCQATALRLPDVAVASAWLAGQGVGQPDVMLAAAGGQPLDALEWVALGVDAALWQRLPALLLRGEGGALAAWPLPRVIEALQKVCHDALCRLAGAAPRYFPAAALSPLGGDMRALTAWSQALARHARHAEHPWNAPLMVEALVQQARQALSGKGGGGLAKRAVSVHSDA